MYQRSSKSQIIHRWEEYLKGGALAVDQGPSIARQPHFGKTRHKLD